MLYLNFIGAAQVHRPDDGRPVKVTGRGWALLAYLALEGKATRRELADLFWPGAEETAARQSVRQLLCTVRKGLGEDPFLGSDPLELNPETVRLDVTDFRRALLAGDDAALDTLVRGRLLEGVECGYSDRLTDWRYRTVDQWSRDFGTHLLSRYGLALVAGDRHGMGVVLDQAQRIGMDPAVFPLATDHDNGPFLPTRTGPDALAAMVYRARPQLPGLMVRCLDNPANEAGDFIASLVRGIPEATRPCWVHLAGADLDVGAPLCGAVALLRALVNSPGGAGVNGRTRILAAGGEPSVAPAELPHALADALADALEAVLVEAPLIVALPARALTSESARVIREALASSTTTDGLTVILLGTDVRELSSAAIQEIHPALPHSTSLMLDASGGPAAPPFPPSQSPRRRKGYRVWSRVAAGIVILALVVVGMAFRSSVDPVAALDGGELMICSNRAGPMQLYRVDPIQLGVERVSPLEVLACPVPSTDGWDESGYLVAPVRDQEQTVVVKLDLRGNRRRDAPELARTALPQSVAGPAMVFYPFGPGRSLAMEETQRNDSLVAAILDHRTWSWQEVRLPVDGIYRSWVGAVPPEVFATVRRGGAERLVRVNLESGSVEVLTPPDHDVSRALVWGGGHIIYQEGASGEAEDGSLELWDLDPNDGTLSRLTSNDWNDHEVVVNADGTGACWKSEESGHWSSDVMAMDFARRKPLRLTRSTLRESLCAWTPDGDAVLYQRSVERPDRRTSLMIQSTRGGKAQEVVPPGSVNIFVGFFRPGTDADSLSAGPG